MSRFVGIGAAVFLSIVVLSCAGAMVISPSYAVTTIALTVAPPNPTFGDLVEFQGTITPKAGVSQEIAVNLYRSSGCNISQYLFNIEGSTERTGSSFSIAMRLGVAYLVYVGPGTYSAFAYISSSPNISSNCLNFTVFAPVPEFPVGWPILLIFMLIACGLITRRSTQKKPATRTR
jgi:hypothetical protein